MASGSIDAAPTEPCCPSARRCCAPSCILVVLTLGASASLVAGDWKVQPQLNVSERFSDNALLSASDPDSGFITKIAPGVRIQRQGGRVRADIDYSLDTFFYHGIDRSSVTGNNLRASLNADLIDPWFYLDADASIRRSASSLLGVFGADQTTGGDFSEVTSVSATPRMRYRHGNMWSGEASLRTSYVSSSQGGLSDSVGNELRVGIDSGTAFGKLGWSADYFADSVRYSSSQAETNSQKFDAGVSYRVVPRVKLLANAGYEKLDSQSLTDQISSSTWSVGTLWQPTSRTSLQATVGHRFFGPSYGLNLSQRTRRTTWSLSYSEEVTSTRSQLDLTGDIRRQLDTFLQAGGVTDPIERARQIDAFVGRITDQNIVFTDQLYLQKRLQGSVIWDLRKNTFVLSGYNSTRDVDAVGGRRSVIFGNSDFNVSRTIKESGISGTWNWQFMPRTSTVTSATTNVTEFTDIDRNDKGFLLSFGLLQQLSRYASGVIEFRHQRRDSTGAGSDYKENSLEAGLQIAY
jgi:uncharacterized protein (PEP-CTERM system associated)